MPIGPGPEGTMRGSTRDGPMSDGTRCTGILLEVTGQHRDPKKHDTPDEAPFRAQAEKA